MKFELYKDVVLARDLPKERLKRGDIVKLVEHHVARDGEDGYSAEVFNALGETITVMVGRVTPCAPSERSGQTRGAQQSDTPYRVTYLPVV